MCRVHGIVHEASEVGRRRGWAVRRTPRTSFATQAVYNLHSGAVPVHLAQLFKWAQPQIDAYLRAVEMAAEHSGGGIVADVPRTVHDWPGHEDSLILDLAAEVGALLIVSNDTDLVSMSPWRGTPVIEPAAFAAKVDAMRRHARRRRR